MGVLYHCCESLCSEQLQGDMWLRDFDFWFRQLPVSLSLPSVAVSLHQH
jgi:hypothetical protein